VYCSSRGRSAGCSIIRGREFFPDLMHRIEYSLCQRGVLYWLLRSRNSNTRFQPRCTICSPPPRERSASTSAADLTCAARTRSSATRCPRTRSGPWSSTVQYRQPCTFVVNPVNVQPVWLPERRALQPVLEPDMSFRQVISKNS
jgi:hypothetical protein